MKRVLLLALILLIISGCSNLKKEEDDNNNGLDIVSMQTAIGATDDRDTFDRQKFSYVIAISNKTNTKVQRESIEVVFTEWIKQKLLGDKVTELTLDTESIVIKGYSVFDAKGLAKNEIVNHQPFIDGVRIVTDAGENIFIKRQTH